MDNAETPKPPRQNIVDKIRQEESGPEGNLALALALELKDDFVPISGDVVPEEERAQRISELVLDTTHDELDSMITELEKQSTSEYPNDKTGAVKAGWRQTYLLATSVKRARVTLEKQ